MLWNLYCHLARERRYDAWYIFALLAAETMLSVWIIRNISYTEIDWQAYMQEVRTWYDEAQYDYRQIRGDTGPLVYPAGFLYLFQALRALTDEQVSAAQLVFVVFYVATQAIVLLMYQFPIAAIRKDWQTKSTASSSSSSSSSSSVPYIHWIWVWRLAMAGLCLSKRLHSIFLLRLFNDGPTMLVLYLSMYLFARQQWNAGCVVFSLAVSLKMNVLLFAPGLLLLLLQTSRYNLVTVAARLAVGCALPQLLLGAPFLLRFPVSYLRKAFELDRVFFYQWTVNWKMLSPEFFVSKPWAVFLLACHLGTLAALAVRWIQHYRQSTEGRLSSPTTSPLVLSPVYIIHTMLVSNFVGIVFARTLHYQFYVSETTSPCFWRASWRHFRGGHAGLLLKNSFL